MRNVNEFPIESATFAAATCSMGRDFYRFSSERASRIDAGEKTTEKERERVIDREKKRGGGRGEHHNKNFIMALTIDLHRPLLARGVSVASLVRGHRAQYTRIPRIISPTSTYRDTVSLLTNPTLG